VLGYSLFCYRYLDQELKSHLFQEKMEVSSVTQDFIWRVGSRRLNLEFHLEDGRKRELPRKSAPLQFVTTHVICDAKQAVLLEDANLSSPQ
jgi:hypothetical protein